MKEEKHEGIVLRSIPFKEREKIITLFTPTRGLISLIIKGISKKKNHLLTLASPFTQAEYHFTVRQSSLFRFRDATLINTHTYLREKLSYIETAAKFSYALLHSQLPDKPAPGLYQLMITYLKFFPSFEEPALLYSSFLLKLLKHEGHLSLNPYCSLCNEPSTHLHLGEPYCSKHAPLFAHSLTSDEWNTITTLMEARNLKTLKEMTVSFELQEKIEKIFTLKFKNQNG